MNQIHKLSLYFINFLKSRWIDIKYQGEGKTYISYFKILKSVFYRSNSVIHSTFIHYFHTNSAQI